MLLDPLLPHPAAITAATIAAKRTAVICDWRRLRHPLDLSLGEFVMHFYQIAAVVRTTLCGRKRAPINHRTFAALLGGVLLILSGCAAQKDPPEATISWLGPRSRAAKPPDCAMPTLAQLPSTDYQQIAIVEVDADYDEDPAVLDRLARREACDTGADALVITDRARQQLGGSDRADIPQDSKAPGGNEMQHTPDVGEAGHKGSFLNGVAIIYGGAKTH